MQNDWQAGDLALCVDDSVGTVSEQCLQRGKVYTVEALDVDPAFAQIGLHLTGVPRPWSAHWQRSVGWGELRFRKIRPHTPDEQDTETIALLQGKPAQVPA